MRWVRVFLGAVDGLSVSLRTAGARRAVRMRRREVAWSSGAVFECCGVPRGGLSVNRAVAQSIKYHR